MKVRKDNIIENQPVTVASLPLPSGAATLAEQQSQTTHLATIAGDTTAIETAVQIMDDWDESDRAKVNIIVGQAGIAAGTGVDGATVPRVTLATNVGLPAGTNNIGDVDILSIAAGDNNIGNVDIVSSALPTGAATSAAQTDKSQFTKITDGTDTALVTASGEQNVLESNSASIKTAVEIIDNAISGSEMQVDVVASLPAGTNNIGDVDVLSIAAGDNNIGNVDIVTMPTVTVNAHAVTNAGTFAVQVDGAALTALQLIDNIVSGAGANITQLGGVNVSMDTGVRDSGTQRVTIATNDSVPVTGTFWQATQPVSGTVTSTNETVASATLANVAASATSVTVLDSAAGRKAAHFFNDSSSFCYLKFGSTASTTSFTVKVDPFGFYEIPQPVYTGIVDGIWDSATGSIRVTSM